MPTFQHKKSLGQHFLNSEHIPRKMCDAATLTAGETVLEIGPGTGILTRELLARGAQVIAVEADLRAITSLQETFPSEIASGQLDVRHADARKLFPSELGLMPHMYTVVANIPYYLSGLLFRQLLDTECQPHTLVFLIQKELAERIARDPKESLLSLSIKAFGDPTYICTVKRGHFTPPPNVDSAIIKVANISQERLESIPNERFFELLHLGFGQKRKQLLGNLSQTHERGKVLECFTLLGIETTIRAEDLSLKEWVSLARSLFPQI